MSMSSDMEILKFINSTGLPTVPKEHSSKAACRRLVKAKMLKPMICCQRIGERLKFQTGYEPTAKGRKAVAAGLSAEGMTE